MTMSSFELDNTYKQAKYKVFKLCLNFARVGESQIEFHMDGANTRHQWIFKFVVESSGTDQITSAYEEELKML